MAKHNKNIQYFNDKFNEKLDFFVNNGFALKKRNDYFSCGYPGENLIKSGLNVKHEIILHQSVVKKAIGLKKGKKDEAHDLKINDLYDLPEKIQNPIIVISGNISTSRLIFIEINTGDRNVLAALHFNYRNELGVFSSIASIYSKPNHVIGLLIQEALFKNEIWHYDGKKIKGLLSVTGQLQLLPRIKANLSGTNINQKKSQVKFNQTNLLKRIYKADDCTDTRDCIINLFDCFESIKLLELKKMPYTNIQRRISTIVKRFENLAEKEGVRLSWQESLEQYRNDEPLEGLKFISDISIAEKEAKTALQLLNKLKL